MKRVYPLVGIIFTMLLFMLPSCKEKTQEFEMSGNLSNVSDRHFYIAFEAGDSLRVDTVRINPNGDFSFKGEIDTLSIVSLYFNQNAQNTYALVDKGWRIELKGNVLYPDLIEVNGGDINDDLTAFKKENASILSSRLAILDTLRTTGESDTIKSEHITQLENVNAQLIAIVSDYITTNPQKVASSILLHTFYRGESTLDVLDDKINLLQDAAREFYLTSEMKSFSEKAKTSLIGKDAPNFRLKDLKGKYVNLIDHRGRYLLLSFISSEDESSEQEYKLAIDEYNKLKKKAIPINFLGIATDIEAKPLPASLLKDIKWSILTEENGLLSKTLRQYNVYKTPYHILISPTGTILKRSVSLSSLESALDKIISENK